ncbi:Exocyst complex component 4 [Blomia tropicalis]|nr:Exocyst complex component 4 [Blomia tropicalis]
MTDVYIELMFTLKCIGNMKLSKFKLVCLTFRVQIMIQMIHIIINRFLAFTCGDQPTFYQATLFVLAEADGPQLYEVSTWPLIIGKTFSFINLATDHWEDFLEHQLGHRSLGRLSRTSTWPLNIGKTFSNINLAADHWEDFLEHQLGHRSLGRLSRTSTWPPIIGKTFSNINLTADHWEDFLEHQLGHRSLGRLSRTSTWPPIIGKTFSNIDLAADHWEDFLEHQLGHRSLGRLSRTSTWPPIIRTTFVSVKYSFNCDLFEFIKPWIVAIESKSGLSINLLFHNVSVNLGHSFTRDINRLLKSLLNWLSLREHYRYCGEFVTRGEPLSNVYVGSVGGESFIPSVTIGIDSNRRRLINHQISFDGSPIEIRLRNMRETDILTTNLNKMILLWQDRQLEQLAQLQESFKWMVDCCDHPVSSIVSKREHGMANIMLSGNNVDLSIGMESYLWPKRAICCQTDLEVRIHRFYHLQTLDGSFFTTPAPHHDSSSSDQRFHALAEHFSDDPKIIPLLDDLHDQLQRSSLKLYKMVLVFESLDHLLSSIFINSVLAVHRIKSNGIKRSCRAFYHIQRRLAAITRSRKLAY